MKVLKKSDVQTSNLINQIMTERKILVDANSEFVVKLHYAFQTDEKLFLV